MEQLFTWCIEQLICNLGKNNNLSYSFYYEHVVMLRQVKEHNNVNFEDIHRRHYHTCVNPSDTTGSIAVACYGKLRSTIMLVLKIYLDII